MKDEETYNRYECHKRKCNVVLGENMTLQKLFQ